MTEHSDDPSKTQPKHTLVPLRHCIVCVIKPASTRPVQGAGIHLLCDDCTAIDDALAALLDANHVLPTYWTSALADHDQSIASVRLRKQTFPSDSHFTGMFNRTQEDLQRWADSEFERLQQVWQADLESADHKTQHSFLTPTAVESLATYRRALETVAPFVVASFDAHHDELMEMCRSRDADAALAELLGVAYPNLFTSQPLIGRRVSRPAHIGRAFVKVPANLKDMTREQRRAWAESIHAKMVGQHESE